MQARTWIIIAVVFCVAVAIGIAAGGRTQSAQPPHFQIPAAQIELVNNRVVRVDARSGEVFGLAGLGWERSAGGVGNAADDRFYFRVVRRNDGDLPFLVDLETGFTWILVDRGGGNAAWQALD